jgi:hypothetical protein
LNSLVYVAPNDTPNSIEVDVVVEAEENNIVNIVNMVEQIESIIETIDPIDNINVVVSENTISENINE